ncbi:hypothetical protein C1X87_09530 [Pseudomonas sp. GP01-A14]|nr:hypothetical protein C1X87_09530 [Pseudomonas sp. GP01-A14]PMV09419.1 hypothetical protein C1X83_20685 [Pseudomonas sp. GP01-A4]
MRHRARRRKSRHRRPGCSDPTASGYPNVGAGLLAKALVQSTDVLTDTPHSRASPLPRFRACLVKLAQVQQLPDANSLRIGQSGR